MFPLGLAIPGIVLLRSTLPPATWLLQLAPLLGQKWRSDLQSKQGQSATSRGVARHSKALLQLAKNSYIAHGKTRLKLYRFKEGPPTRKSTPLSTMATSEDVQTCKPHQLKTKEHVGQLEMGYFRREWRGR